VLLYDVAGINETVQPGQRFACCIEYRDMEYAELKSNILLPVVHMLKDWAEVFF